MNRQGAVRIVVSTLTRRRPKMLKDLVASWKGMRLPEKADVYFLVVENDDAPQSRQLVEEMQEGFEPGKLLYHHEPELGIPFGRNRAAKEAIHLGADLLAFVDDDEVVAEDWLVAMINGWRNTDALLLGAPLRAAPMSGDETFWQKMMYRNIAARYAKKEKRARQRATLDDTPGVTVVTNNWLGSLSLFTEHNIWFDETMRFTGGTDSKFCAQVRAKGLGTGWVEDAFVYEEVPPERLCFVYQFRRGRDQSNTNFRRKIATKAGTRWSTLVSVPIKVLAALILMMALPINKGATLLSFARTSGWVVGRVSAFFGYRSELYKEVTGA